MLKESYEILNQLRLKNGLYIASPSSDYGYVWIRDSLYMSLPYLNKNDGIFEKTLHRLFDLFRQYEWKLDILQHQKPIYDWEYIHSRYSAANVEEIHDQEWGHAQHDAIGLFLFLVGKGIRQNKKIIRDEKDLEILKKLVGYLQTIEYWHDPDNGMWEEAREIHMSSIGAVVAGLTELKEIIEIPETLILKGTETLLNLFPHESISKKVDLAQLSLIYPYRILTGEKAKIILDLVEKILVRKRGIIRYQGDSYYSLLEKEYGRNNPPELYYDSEAEWCFGFPWLSLCFKEIADFERSSFYLQKTEEIMLENAILPELYYAHSDRPNPNTPLGWSSAMYILANESENNK